MRTRSELEAAVEGSTKAISVLLERKGKLRAQVDNLSILVRRLVRALKRHSPDSPLAKQAMDYLKRNGLEGRITREAARAFLKDKPCE